MLAEDTQLKELEKQNRAEEAICLKVFSNMMTETPLDDQVKKLQTDIEIST
jgi:hypothetical protein